MAFAFLQRKQAAQQAAKQTAAQVYRQLITTAADLGDLSDDDGERLVKAAAEIGLPMDAEGELAPSVAHHARLVAEEKRLRPQAEAVAKIEGQRDKSCQAATAFDRETQAMVDKLIAERKPQSAKLLAAAEALGPAHASATTTACSTVAAPTRCRSSRRSGSAVR